MKLLLKFISLIDKSIQIVLKTIVTISFISLGLLLTAIVLARFIPSLSLLWAEEIVELVFACLVFYGIAALWITREHFIAGDWIETKLFNGERSRHFYKMILEMVALVFAMVFLYYSYQLTTATIAVTNVLAIPKKVFYSSMPISGSIMILYSIRHVGEEFIKIFKPISKETHISAKV